jgi:hypothetical protein
VYCLNHALQNLKMEGRILDGLSAADIDELFPVLTDDEIEELGRQSYARFHFPDEATNPKRPRVEEKPIFQLKKVSPNTKNRKLI